MKISCIKLIPNIFKRLIIPNISIDDFKQNFVINEEIFVLTLIDDNGYKLDCLTSEVVKGIVSGTELECIIENRNNDTKRTFIPLLMSIPLFIASCLTPKLVFPLSYVFPLAAAYCLFLFFRSTVYIGRSIVKGRK